MEIYAQAVVILDTNQWDRMPMLRHGLAASLLYTLRRNNMVLLLPELVRHEVEMHLIEKYASAHKKLAQGLGEVRQLLGEAIDVPRASDGHVRNAFQERLDELDDLAVATKTQDEDYVEAGKMVLRMEAPNSRSSQQYKDSLLWRQVIRAAHFNEVYFITEDAAFFGKSGALASNLFAEAEHAECSVTAFAKVEDLLSHLQSDDIAPLDGYFVDVFQDYVKQRLASVVAAYGPFQMDECQQFEVSRFLTDNPRGSTLTSTFDFYLVNSELGQHSDPIASVIGAASAEFVDRDGEEEVYNVQLEQISITGITSHQDYEIAEVDFREPEPFTAPVSVRRWVFKKEI